MLILTELCVGNNYSNLRKKGYISTNGALKEKGAKKF